MKLFETLDGLFVGTRYLVWGIAAIGIIGSVILLLANIPLGLGSAAVFGASFLLSIAVTLLLLPKTFAVKKLAGSKKYITGVILLVAAILIMGMIWLTNGGFPAVNLIFI